MVSRKTRQRKTVSWKWWVFCGVLCVVVGISTILLYWHFMSQAEEPEPEPDSEPVVESPADTLPAQINFQPVVDEWVSSIKGNKSVLIYDLERDEIVGAYNTSAQYNTASLYKLFVVYEGYRRIQKGEWDGSARAGATGYSILECLDLAIRSSHSACAETLWAMIGRSELDRIIEKDFQITNSDISSLLSNPHDIMVIMKIFYQHQDITDQQLIGAMEDSFLNQPKTEYDWRQGLPSGFSKARVYNKVGWDYNPNGYWNIYHDAAIVEFPEANRHFIVVAMTNQVPYQQITKLGTMIENAFYNNQ